MWRYHFDLAGGRAGWNCGVDFGTRCHGERGRRAVKSDAGRAGQIRSQDRDRRSHLARGLHCLYEGAKPDGQTEQEPCIAGAALIGCPVELAVSPKSDSVWHRIGGVKQSELPRWGYSENRTGSPVEVPRRPLYQPIARRTSIGTASLGTKTVKSRQVAFCGHFENCTSVGSSAFGCRSVENAVSGFDQRSLRVGPVSTVGQRTKIIKRG